MIAAAALVRAPARILRFDAFILDPSRAAVVRDEPNFCDFVLDSANFVSVSGRCDGPTASMVIRGGRRVNIVGGRHADL
jgi:hypothetical protein